MLELQRRQRIEVSERFKRQLNRVNELLTNSLEKLPDNLDCDVKAVLPVDMAINGEETEQTSKSNDPCSNLDRIMCNIIDKI